MPKIRQVTERKDHMHFLRLLVTGAATVAAFNIGGHAEAYGIAQRSYFWNRMLVNDGQANLEFALAIQKICSSLRSEPKDERENNQSIACHATCANRPERKAALPDDEPEL